jgi:hypothetical protein
MRVAAFQVRRAELARWAQLLRRAGTVLATGTPVNAPKGEVL